MSDSNLSTTSSKHNTKNLFGLLDGVDLSVFFISGGVLVLFAISALYDIEQVTHVINTSFSASTMYFGAYWQILLLMTFLIGLVLAAGRTGSVVLGGLKSPEFSLFKWLSVIMCTLLAGGGVFWAAAEPIAHLLSPPPLFGSEPSTAQSAYNALAQSFMHWGFLAWAILGSLTSIVYMYLHYEKGLPLRPRTLLYPVFGDRVMTGFFGALIDSCCVLAVVAGTVGPIGFLGLQVSFGLEALLGIPDTYTTQLCILAGLIALYTVSAISGVNRGIQFLSRMNILLAGALILFILLFGPTRFIVDGFMTG
ncbi:BCCT family transporter, partial [Endozoicomonas sp.]|nr:BCCT family transporter [Endozoicomonas sp.]